MEDNNLFELVFNEDSAGVYGYSFVETPAIEEEMISFSKEEEDFRFSDEEKRVIVSPLLIPNIKVYRSSVGAEKKPGWVYLSEDTIAKLQENFFKNKNTHNSTVEHSDKIDEVFIFESWIIEDPQTDKSAVLGFKNLPKGTWMVSAKINNDELWNEYIKTGLVKGLSIDALLKPVKTNEFKFKINKMNRSTLSEVVKLSMEKIALEGESQEFKISDDLSVYASELVEGSLVLDAEKNPLKDFSFEFEGNTYLTDADGFIVSITPIEMAPVEEVEMAEEPVVPSDLEAMLAEKEAMVLELEAKVLALEEENMKLKDEVASKTEEAVMLSKQTPATEGIQTIELAKDTKVDRKNSPLETFRELLKQAK